MWCQNSQEQKCSQYETPKMVFIRWKNTIKHMLYPYNVKCQVSSHLKRKWALIALRLTCYLFQAWSDQLLTLKFTKPVPDVIHCTYLVYLLNSTCACLVWSKQWFWIYSIASLCFFLTWDLNTKKSPRGMWSHCSVCIYIAATQAAWRSSLVNHSVSLPKFTVQPTTTIKVNSF